MVKVIRTFERKELPKYSRIDAVIGEGSDEEEVITVYESRTLPKFTAVDVHGEARLQARIPVESPGQAEALRAQFEKLQKGEFEKFDWAS